MKKLHPPGDNRVIIATSEHLLNEIILPSVFTTFKAKRFRKLADFENLSTAEKDRIFNEIEVAGICLAIFCLQVVKRSAKIEEAGDYHFWQDIEKHLPQQFQQILISYGVENSDAKLVNQLIDMRREEYEKIAEEIWDANDNLKSESQKLTPELKLFSARVQAIAVDASNHICRGKIKEKDPLIKYLVNWLTSLFNETRKFVNNL